LKESMRNEGSEHPFRGCLRCGGSHVNTDHLYPQCMVGPKSKRSGPNVIISDNPLIGVVYRPSNEFPLCEKVCHPDVDSIKTAVFLGISTQSCCPIGSESYCDNCKKQRKRLFADPKLMDPRERGEPEDLVEFLTEDYPRI
jgi:hypothetical protein